MNIRLVKVAMDPVTCRVDLDAVKFAVTANTIMLYGSAPSFPQVIYGLSFFLR
jgi:sphinganine-1-phosphate aldolase